MGSLLVITGPPGAGKSTVAEVVATRSTSSVLVEGDAFYAFLRSGSIEPWRPESHRQNTVVTEVAGAAAGGFVRGGYDTVYDGVVGPWYLDAFLTATGLTTLDYVVLLPPVEVCVARVLTRANHGFRDEAAARHMHDHFTREAPERRHVVDAVEPSAEGVATRILSARERGELRYVGG